MRIELLNEAKGCTIQQNSVDKSVYQLPLVDLNSSVAPLDELARLLEIPGSSFFDQCTLNRIEECRRWHKKHVTLWHQMTVVSIKSLEEETVVLKSGIRLNSSDLVKQLKKANAEELIVAGITLGSGLDRHATELWNQDRYDESYILSMYGTALIEEARNQLNNELCCWAEARNIGVLAPLAPGYNNWELEEISLLFKLLNQREDSFLEEHMTIFSSGMLTPVHSTLYVLGISRDQQLANGKNKMIPCNNCQLVNCRYRRMPEKHGVKRAIFTH